MNILRKGKTIHNLVLIVYLNLKGIIWYNLV